MFRPKLENVTQPITINMKQIVTTVFYLAEYSFLFKQKYVTTLFFILHK